MLCKLNSRYLLAGLFATSVFLSACSSDSDDNDITTPVSPQGITQSNLPAETPGIGNSVYDNIVRNTELALLLEAINAAGLANVPDNEALEFTVFAPDNTAFQTLEDANPDDDIVDSLFANPSALAPILERHILLGTTLAVDASALSGSELTTVNGDILSLESSNSSPSGLAVSGADITIPDSDSIPGTSVGVVHIIDKVLLLN